MGDEDTPREVQEIILVQTVQATFEGSGYDAGLSIDTTPVSRVDWAAGPQPEHRSAYDAKMIADTTPTARPEPPAPPGTGTHGPADTSSGQ
jgi:hypothetical protein